jgi:hypothetical protein
MALTKDQILESNDLKNEAVENGARLFEASDVDRLGLKSAAAIESVFAVAQRLNGLGAKAEDEALKNSKADQT